MRLNKYIAHSGVCSRRHADELIEKGKVKVNGLTAETGYDVAEGDVVEVDGRVIRPEKRLVYYMLNKPPGCLTAVSDEQTGKPTVMELMDDIPERIYPVGRLDFNTTGLLIMTNDGELAHHVMHPRNHIWKTYRARVSGFMTASEAKRLEKGVDIGDYVTRPARVEIISQNEGSSVVEISIAEGKNRQVRRMCEAVGHKVVELERISIGNVKLGHIKQGQYRKLSKGEIEYLRGL